MARQPGRVKKAASPFQSMRQIENGTLKAFGQNAREALAEIKRMIKAASIHPDTHLLQGSKTASVDLPEKTLDIPQESGIIGHGQLPHPSGLPREDSVRLVIFPDREGV